MSNNLTSLLAGTVKASGTKKSEAIIASDPVLVSAVAEWLAADAQENDALAVKARVDPIMRPALRRAWFAGNAGKAKPAGRVKIIVPERAIDLPAQPERRMVIPAAELNADFAAQWYPGNVNVAEIGVPAEYVRTKFELKIAGDEIPEEKQEAFVAALMKVVIEHGVESAVSAKVVPYPKKSFGIDRHSKLTPDQNEALETAGLCTRLALKG